ncbi:probable protein SYM1 [Coccomyxa sp. Obi]|nr:probable protein SYM1 [Coccomyxa sp. Obi]
MTALGKSGVLQSGRLEGAYKSCSLQARPRASRQAARSPVQALAAPSRQRQLSQERRSLENSLPPAQFVQSTGTSVDAVRHRPDGNRGISLQAASDAVGEAWRNYSRRVETDPVPTKAMTSLVGFMLGDFLAQRIEGRPFNPLRCLRLGGYGLTVDGPIGHMWYKILDKFVYPNDPQCNAAVLLKTAADQLLWAPVMTCVYFAFLRTAEGHPELIMSTIQAKLVQTVVANYVLWPAAHFINFKFVPTQHRILYNNVVSIFWNAFLSTLSHAPTIEPNSFMESFQQYADTLPEPLHERAAEFVDSIYKTSLPLHERAAEFAESLKLPLGTDLTKLKLPSSIKVSPTRVHPESFWFDNWD